MSIVSHWFLWPGIHPERNQSKEKRVFVCVCVCVCVCVRERDRDSERERHHRILRFSFCRRKGGRMHLVSRERNMFISTRMCVCEKKKRKTGRRRRTWLGKEETKNGLTEKKSPKRPSEIWNNAHKRRVLLALSYV